MRAIQRTDTAIPPRTAGATIPPTAPAGAGIPAPTQTVVTPDDASVPDTPVPTQPTARPAPTSAPHVTPTETRHDRPLPRPTVPGVDLHDSQVVTSVGQMRPTMAPWRDMGANRLFSTHVFGTPFILNEKGEVLPWIATAITSRNVGPYGRGVVWTMKLREDAVFQDGTPITAADFKAYWEHGAKPENIPAWGGASLTLFRIAGWKDLMAGDAAEASGLRVVDDHTLEMEPERGGILGRDYPVIAWPLYMAAWHVGISKPEQVLSDESWGNAPIGAGPFSLTYDPDSGLTELTRVDLVGKHWNGPHDTPMIEKLVLPNIPDAQAQVLRFENGELDLMKIDSKTYNAALDPAHRFNPLLYVSPYGGLTAIKPTIDLVPLEDLSVRKALAHGQDMEEIVKTIWGPTAVRAKGLISRHVPCHNPDAGYQPYDPDLARQWLSNSSYGSADNLPPLIVDLIRPDEFDMGRLIKAYWKDNLGVDLEVRQHSYPLSERRLGFVSGVHLEARKLDWESMRRHYVRTSHVTVESWSPDPAQIVSSLPPLNFYYDIVHGPSDIPSGYPHLLALFVYANSLPLDHPDRCEVFQAYEEEYLDKVYILPIREVEPVRWLVQPWLVGFQSTFNQDFNTLNTAYVVRH